MSFTPYLAWQIIDQSDKAINELKTYAFSGGLCPGQKPWMFTIYASSIEKGIRIREILAENPL